MVGGRRRALFAGRRVRGREAPDPGPRGEGQPAAPPQEGESVRVTFVPILPGGKPPSDHYFAEFDPADATFRSAGKDKKGMPPGKYRVAVEYKKDKQDVFGGKFDENQSPFVFDIDSRTSEIVIDLDNPPK